MALARVSAQVILRTNDNIPANYVTNTYHFLMDYATVDPTPGADDLEGITDQVNNALVDLYNDLQNIWGGLLQTGHRIKYVNIDEPAPQYPYQEELFDLGSITASQFLPNEVCIVSSFEADQVAGINQATRRGRVFLGPLAIGALPNGGRVSPATQSLIATSFDTFSGKQDTAGFTGWQWMVYSRKRDEMARVTNGHVDNAFDTQRRRGLESSVRTTWVNS